MNCTVIDLTTHGIYRVEDVTYYRRKIKDLLDKQRQLQRELRAARSRVEDATP